MTKSGLADSPFFSSPGDSVTSPTLPITEIHKKSSPVKKTIASGTKHDTVIPRYHGTMTPRYHDTIVELVRKAVKDYGKEAATHRFTQDEKQAIADIIYTYQSRGIRTSENEITRIAVNLLVADFKENGETSILDKVLKALNG